jgi:hypothetical protein
MHRETPGVVRPCAPHPPPGWLGPIPTWPVAYPLPIRRHLVQHQARQNTSRYGGFAFFNRNSLVPAISGTDNRLIR